MTAQPEKKVETPKQLTHLLQTRSFLRELGVHFSSQLPQELITFARGPLLDLLPMWNEAWEYFWLDWFFMGFKPYWASEELPRLPNGLNPHKTLAETALALVPPTNIENLDRALVENILNTPFTFWKIANVTTGELLELESVYFEKKVKVFEHSKDSGLSAGDFLFGRIVEIDGVAIFFGCAPLVFAAEHCEQFQEIEEDLLEIARECESPESELSQLEASHHRELDYFLMELVAERASKLLFNSASFVDGTALAPKVLSFTLNCSTFDILHKLETIRDLHVPLEESKDEIRSFALLGEGGHSLPTRVEKNGVQIITPSAGLEDWTIQKMHSLFGSMITKAAARELDMSEIEVVPVEASKEASNQA